MGTDNGGSIQYGYNFKILNTFEMGHLKKTCSHIPSRMDLSQTPGETLLCGYTPLGCSKFFGAEAACRSPGVVVGKHKEEVGRRPDKRENRPILI